MENQPRTFGYARVSTKEQHEDRQIHALMEFGVPEGNIHIDKQSGKDFNRPAYQRLLKKMRPGDVMVVKSIDRLGRDYAETLENWQLITKNMRCAIVVLDMPLLDTRQKENRDLMGTFIADLVLQILTYVSATEREYIRQRQREGVEAAQKRGVKFGRPIKKRSAHWYDMRAAWQSKTISARDAAKALSVHHTTFLDWVHNKP